MKLIKFSQPCDYRYRGREIHINPEDVMSIKAGENYDLSLITLRSGESYTVSGSLDDIASLINQSKQ